MPGRAGLSCSFGRRILGAAFPSAPQIIMKILHTSDWHLGRSFGPASLLQAQQAFLDWLIAQCREHQVGLVVMAGDVFDRAVAPTEAVVMFRNALERMLDTGAIVAVITGNHDGADRVASYDTLLDLSGAYVRGGYTNPGDVLHLHFPDGPLDVVMLPFLDPQAAPDDYPDATDVPVDATSDGAFERRVRRTHQSVLRSAIAAARGNLTASRSVAIAHAYVAGATTSESERQLSVGGTGTVDAALFDGFSYTALGHLHRPQTVGGRDTLRYAGSPMAYSFSESQPKSIAIVDMAPDGTCTTETVPVPVGRAVVTLTGTMDELLSTTPPTSVVESFVRAIVTDPGVVLDAKQRLSAVYPHVVEIDLRPPVASGTSGSGSFELATMLPEDAIEAFWLDSIGANPADDERALLHQAVAEARLKVTA